MAADLEGSFGKSQFLFAIFHFHLKFLVLFTQKEEIIPPY